MNGIDKFLEDMCETKSQINKLEKYYEKLKRKASRFMDNENTDRMEGKHYVARRNVYNREHISKKDLPKDIWDRYKSITLVSTLKVGRKKRS